MKKLFFGVAVVAIALSASAFTNIDEGDFYVYIDQDEEYVLIGDSEFDPVNCLDEAEVCAYEVITEEELPSIVSREEILDLEIADVDDAVIPVVNPVTNEPYLGGYDLN